MLYRVVCNSGPRKRTSNSKVGTRHYYGTPRTRSRSARRSPARARRRRLPRAVYGCPKLLEVNLVIFEVSYLGPGPPHQFTRIDSTSKSFTLTLLIGTATGLRLLYVFKIHNNGRQRLGAGPDNVLFLRLRQPIRGRRLIGFRYARPVPIHLPNDAVYGHGESLLRYPIACRPRIMPLSVINTTFLLCSVVSPCFTLKR